MKNQKIQKIQKVLIYIIAAMILLIITTELLTEWQEQYTAVYPQGTPTDLSSSVKIPLREEDYTLLTAETGLMPKVIDEIMATEDNPLAVLERYQQIFYRQPEYTCNGIAEISSAERICGKEDYYPFYQLLPGDVLLTKNTHTLFYRHGHSALVINETTLLEAAEIGTDADFCDAAAWGGYPSVMQLRIKEEVARSCGMTAAELGEAVAAYARETLKGEHYSLLCGLGSIGIDTNQTQCAYLIWEAFRHFGIDASSRDFPITPQSLWQSGVFEVISYRGFEGPDY